jgi:hypothetical protein
MSKIREQLFGSTNRLLEALMEENKRLRIALETYANEKNWHREQSIQPWRTHIWIWDGGELPNQVAQAALQPQEGAAEGGENG